MLSDSQKKIILASTRVIRSLKFNIRSNYKKLNESTSTHRVSVVLIESKALILTFQFDKTAKLHAHMMRILHALIFDETLRLEPAREKSKIYKKVEASSDWSLWLKFIKKKIESHVKNEIWELVTSSNNRSKALTSRWVFKIKYELDDNVLKYKTQWVIHEYKQQYNIDYNEIWSKIMKSAIFRLIFDIAAI